MRRLLEALVLGALVVACSEQATAPQPRTPAIAANFMNNPDNGNPRIWRYHVDQYATSWTDPANGLRASHWTYQAVEGCGDTPDGMLDVQEVGLWDPEDWGAFRTSANVVGQVWIRIRDMNAPGDCFGNKLVASGWGTFHYTDNDEFFWAPNSRKNVDSWTFRAEGVLTTPDGGTVHYSGHYHAVWDGTWIIEGQVADLRNEVFQVNVH